MDATTDVVTALPVLTAMQIELMRVLERETDEKVAALNLSCGVGEFRSHVVRLARRLNLPEQESPAKELSQLVRETRRMAAARSASMNGAGKLNGSSDSAQWQRKLAEVAIAIANGVLITVDPFKIRPMPGQPRDYFPSEEQGSLEDSLGLVGQIQDMIIRKKAPPHQQMPSTAPVYEGEDRIWRIADTEYEICDGERRWRGSMEKGLVQIRAKLIEIDDEGAYLVAAVSNFNRVGHTTLERARNIKRLMSGDNPIPLEVICAMQGISKSTADKLLQTLQLPPDIHVMMNPVVQRDKGEEVLGKMPSYEVARLAANPVLHEHARDLANRYTKRQIKLPELRIEVDRILSRSGDSRDLLGERNQPSRRLLMAERRLTVALDAARDVVGRLEDLKTENTLPERAAGMETDLNRLAELAEKALALVGGKREK